jgi:two-component system LytT family response regulator
MARMAAQLDPQLFLRIHRSQIVNISRIKELQPHFNGEYIVVLQSGVKLKISRGYRTQAKAVLGLV